MVKEFLKWNDEKIEEIDYENDKHWGIKAFGRGCLEGLVEGAVIMYVPLLISCYYLQNKALKK